MAPASTVDLNVAWQAGTGQFSSGPELPQFLKPLVSSMEFAMNRSTAQHPSPVMMRLLTQLFIFSFFLLASSLACTASRSEIQQEVAPSPIEETEPEPETAPHPHAAISRPQTGEEVVTSDLNGDGKPDVFKYYLPSSSEGELMLVRREMDLNFDGRLDLWNWYDEKGELLKQAFDLDFDGQIDVFSWFEHGVVVRKELSQRSGDRPDTFKYYDQGQLVRIERDTSGDGKIDTWEYWESGQLDRVGQDLDGDGRVDRWTTPEKVRR